jgi:hypothetical protein
MEGRRADDWYTITHMDLCKCLIGESTNCTSYRIAAASLITAWLNHTTGGYTAPMHEIRIVLLTGIVSYLFLVRCKYVPA